eukprot:g80874.t1
MPLARSSSATSATPSSSSAPPQVIHVEALRLVRWNDEETHSAKTAFLRTIKAALKRLSCKEVKQPQATISEDQQIHFGNATVLVQDMFNMTQNADLVHGTFDLLYADLPYNISDLVADTTEINKESVIKLLNQSAPTSQQKGTVTAEIFTANPYSKDLQNFTLEKKSEKSHWSGIATSKPPRSTGLLPWRRAGGLARGCRHG